MVCRFYVSDILMLLFSCHYIVGADDISATHIVCLIL